MGVSVSTVTVQDTDGFKLVLAGAGVVQVQGESMYITLGTTTPLTITGAFIKANGNEVSNSDASINIYAKVYDGQGTGMLAVWQVV
jgi:hypothetical protein